MSHMSRFAITEEQYRKMCKVHDDSMNIDAITEASEEMAEEAAATINGAAPHIK